MQYFEENIKKKDIIKVGTENDAKHSSKPLLKVLLRLWLQAKDSPVKF